MKFQSIWVQVKPEEIAPDEQHRITWVRFEKDKAIVAEGYPNPAPSDDYKPCIAGEKIVVEEGDVVGPKLASEMLTRYPDKRDNSLAAALNYGLDLWERGRVKSEYAKREGRNSKAEENRKLKARLDRLENATAEEWAAWQAAKRADKASGGNAAEEAFFASLGL